MQRWSSLLIVVTAILVGCAMPYREPVIVGKPGGDSNFPGIVDMLGKAPLDILMIHGMCTHREKWAKESVQGIYSWMGGNPDDVDLEAKPVQGTGITLYQQTLKVAGSEVRANAILWSPLTARAKEQLCYDQTIKSDLCKASSGVPPYPYERATVNRRAKDELMNDCLADALIYQGAARDEINAQMQKAILQAVATSGGLPAPVDFVTAAATKADSIRIVIVSESLGSKVAFDALYQLANNPKTRAAGERTFDRISHVFMKANQLPILALADLGLVGTESTKSDKERAYPADPINALLQRRTTRKDNAGKWVVPRVIAFTDPNDLLSYTLVASPHAASAAYDIVDVVVSNDRTYFGLVEMPTTAHMTYGEKPAVQRLIVCGNPTSKACPR